MILPENTTVRKFLQTIASKYYTTYQNTVEFTDDDYAFFFVEKNKQQLISMIHMSLYEKFSYCLSNFCDHLSQDKNSLETTPSLQQHNIENIHSNILMYFLVIKNMHLFTKEDLDKNINQDISTKNDLLNFHPERRWI
jgi:hypothetical protein